MSAEVPDLSDEPLSVRMDYPGEWWNVDQSERRDERLDDLRETLPEADVVGVVDSDSDGLACEVVLREAFPEDNLEVIQGNGGEFGFELSQMFSFVGEHTDEDTEVVVADLAPNSQFSSFLAGLHTIPGNISVYDHHDWEWFVEESVGQVVDKVVIGGDDMCAAQIVQEQLYPEADEQLAEFLEVTADHDLWIKEDERSDYLSTLSFVLDREDYVSAARQYGADMLSEDDGLRETYEEAEADAEARREIAVNRAEWAEYGDYDVAVTYGSCHQSRVGDSLIEQGADVAVIIQPFLKISFRSTEEAGICAELARSLNGGGHKEAAGASIWHNVEIPEDMDKDDKLPYVWESGGQPAIDFMLDFLKRSL